MISHCKCFVWLIIIDWVEWIFVFSYIGILFVIHIVTEELKALPIQD